MNDAVGYASASWWCVATVSSTASVVAPDLDTLHDNWTLLAAQGSQGQMGPQGIQGPTGADGTSGTSGTQGEQGVQGNQGGQGIEGPVGASGLIWKGGWDANSLYNMNDAVGYASASWWCVATVSSTASVVAPDLDTIHDNWTLLAAQGSQGPQGPAGTQSTQTLQQTVANGDTIIAGDYATQLSSGGLSVSYNNTSLNVSYSQIMFLNGSNFVNLKQTISLTQSVDVELPTSSGKLALTSELLPTKTDYYFVQAAPTASNVVLSYDINTVISFSPNAYVYLPSNPYNGQEVVVVASLSSGNTFIVLSPINDGFIETGNGASQGISISATSQESKFVYTESTYNGTPYWHYYPIERSTVSSSIDSAISNGTISNVTKKLKTTITTAQVLQLFTTPIEVLPAQSGYARIPTNIYIKRNTGTASYTLANNAFLLLNGTTDTNTNINPNPLTSTSVGYTNNSVYLQESVSGSDHGGPYKLQASTGNPTLGNGSLDVYVTYDEFFIGF